MLHIRVNPDHLRELARRFSQTAGDLRALQGQLSNAWGRLNVDSWESQYRGHVALQWWQARSRLSALADQADAIAQFLYGRATRFEEVDGAGRAAIEQMGGAFVAMQQAWSQWFRPRQSLLSFPQDLTGRLLRLGGWVKQIPIAFVASVTGMLSGFLGGTRSLRSVSPPWEQQLEEAADRISPPVTPPTSLSSPSAAPAPSAGEAKRVPLPDLQPADPAQHSSCALYAQARRPDLGHIEAEDEGAYNYIQKFENTENCYRVTTAMAEDDLSTTDLRPGTAVVWDRGVRGADPTYGHVAIVEEVGPDYIEVSEAGWAGGTRRRIPTAHLPDLHFIL